MQAITRTLILKFLIKATIKLPGALPATAATFAAKKTLSVFEPGWLDDKVH